MFHVVSSNGQPLSITPYQPRRAQSSINICLNYLRKDLKLDVEIPKFEVQSSIYKLLMSLTQTEKYAELQGAIFLPVQHEQEQHCSFIKINTPKQDIESDTLEKAINSVATTLNPAFSEDCPGSKNHFCTLILNTSTEKSYPYALKVYQRENFSSFLNLSEWVKTNGDLSLSALKGFKNTLFYVREVKELSHKQRSALALYALLPCVFQNSSVLISSKHSQVYLNGLLRNEKGFLSTFSEKNSNLIEHLN